MSPNLWVKNTAGTGVPRASGDEPEVLEAAATEIWCSPRERG